MLQLNGLKKSFGNIQAVKDLTLEIGRGEVFGLLGPNGAGKSTTIAMAVGLIRPDEGSVVVDWGDSRGDPADPAVRARIGVATQALALYGELTARENLMFFGRVYGLDSSRARTRCDELLERTGLTDRAGDRTEGFSGGMKRRLNLAAALMHDPALVLMDEPTAGVDPQSRNALFDLVRSLQAEGKTIVYTTHYMEEAQRLCDRVGIIDQGRLVALGTVDDLIGAHGGASVVIVQRRDSEERIEAARPLEVLQTLFAGAGSGPALTGVRVDRPDLESVFLHLTGRSLRE